jgi:hypothetical protein
MQEIYFNFSQIFLRFYNISQPPVTIHHIFALRGMMSSTVLLDSVEIVILSILASLGYLWKIPSLQPNP